MEQQTKNVQTYGEQPSRTLTLSHNYSDLATVADVLALQRRGELQSIQLKAKEAPEATKQGIVAAFSVFAEEMADSLNKTLSGGEIEVIADAILDPTEGLSFLTAADLLLFFRQVRRGRWEDYERLNSMKICRWLHEYADERMNVAEQHSRTEAAQRKERPSHTAPESLGYVVRRVVVNGIETEKIEVSEGAKYTPKAPKYLGDNELHDERERQLAALNEHENIFLND